MTDLAEKKKSEKKKSGKFLMIPALLGANFVYSCTSVFTKLSSLQEPLSAKYFLFLGCAVSVLGIYSILWQQIIKRMPVSEAYMYKGTVLLFVLVISAVLFGESITLHNIIGASMIVGGIVLFSKS